MATQQELQMALARAIAANDQTAIPILQQALYLAPPESQVSTPGQAMNVQEYAFGGPVMYPGAVAPVTMPSAPIGQPVPVMPTTPGVDEYATADNAMLAPGGMMIPINQPEYNPVTRMPGIKPEAPIQPRATMVPSIIEQFNRYGLGGLRDFARRGVVAEENPLMFNRMGMRQMF